MTYVMRGISMRGRRSRGMRALECAGFSLAIDHKMLW